MMPMRSVYEKLPVFAQNWACSVAGYQRHRARFTPHFHRTLAEWERSMKGPVEQLWEIQRRRLARMVEIAREDVPWYRDVPPMSQAKDPLQAIRETLAAIPPLEKADYRDHPEKFLSRRIPHRRLYHAKTSGTTGTALTLWYTPEALAEEYATVWRHRRSFGAQFDDPSTTFGGQMIVPVRQNRSPFWRDNAYGGQRLFSIYHLAPENLGAYVDAIHARPGRFVQGYPSAIHLVARALLEAGRPLPPGRLAGVFTSSETLLAFQREAIEKAFGTPVRDRYGVSELAVSMTECEERRLHVDMEFGIVEVETAEETEDYERGPLLVTSLANDATPFFRYRIGDVGTRAKQPCPCGRPGDVFLNVEGRIDDYVATPDGRLVGRLDHVFKDQIEVAEAQILQETRDEIQVLVVPRPTYSAASERRLVREIRSRLGDEIRIDVKLVEEIPREPNGKFRAVMSQVGSLRPWTEASWRPAAAVAPEGQDYMREPLLFRVRKVARYVRLYGASRTIAKVQAQYHKKRTYGKLPAMRSRDDGRAHVGIIGCGGFAYSNIAYYLKKNYGAVIRGAMDIDVNRAASLCQKYGLQYYTDEPERIYDDPKIDIVFIASNHASHAEYAIEALKRDKHVHIEKPHVVNIDQLRRLCDTMSRSKGKVALGFNRPHGRLGRSITEALYSQSGPAMLNWFIAGHEISPDHWYFREEEGGRVLGNLCHWTDFVFQMVPEESRHPITIRPTRSLKSDCDIAVSYTFADGSIAAITFSAMGHTFEGVRERFAAQRGNVLISLDDFKRLQIEVVEKKKIIQPLYRDHGHQERIKASYELARADDGATRPGCSRRYVWETGELFLKTKDALEANETVVIGPYGGP